MRCWLIEINLKCEETQKILNIKLVLNIKLNIKPKY